MRTVAIVGILGVILALGAGWFFLLRTPAETAIDTSGELFQTGGTQTVGVSGGNTTSTNVETAINTQTPIQLSNQKVFKISDGAVVSATVIQTLRPTTTVARYVQQNNGHVFDVALDSSGAVPKAISNTTIPGIRRALWTDGGNGVILQYLEATSLTKTVSLSFPVGQSTTTRPVLIRFLPDGIQDITVSPDGLSVAYLLKTSSGTAGYVAKTDGTGGKQLFTLPLSEVVISWPAKGTLVAQSKSAVGAPGVAFSINTANGAVLPMLYAPSLTLTASPNFSHIVYQSTSGESASTYVRDNKSGKTAFLSYDPYPEKCVWGAATSTYLYCATPIEYLEPNYLDRWHQGAANISESILWFNVATGEEEIIASPGSNDGGVESAIHTMSVSSDDTYLLFVRRGDYSLWGVRL